MGDGLTFKLCAAVVDGIEVTWEGAVGIGTDGSGATGTGRGLGRGTFACVEASLIGTCRRGDTSI